MYGSKEAAGERITYSMPPARVFPRLEFSRAASRVLGSSSTVIEYKQNPLCPSGLTPHHLTSTPSSSVLQTPHHRPDPRCAGLELRASSVLPPLPLHAVLSLARPTLCISGGRGRYSRVSGLGSGRGSGMRRCSKRSGSSERNYTQFCPRSESDFDSGVSGLGSGLRLCEGGLLTFLFVEGSGVLGPG